MPSPTGFQKHSWNMNIIQSSSACRLAKSVPSAGAFCASSSLPVPCGYVVCRLQRVCVRPWVVYVTGRSGGPCNSERLTLSKRIPLEGNRRSGTPYGPSGLYNSLPLRVQLWPLQPWSTFSPGHCVCSTGYSGQCPEYCQNNVELENAWSTRF